MSKAYQERLVALVKDTITLLCKNGLEYNQEFCVEGLLGVTLDKDEVFLIPIKELVADKGVGTSDPTEIPSQDVSLGEEEDAKSPKRERKKKRRHNHDNEALEVQEEGSAQYDSYGPSQWDADSNEPTGGAVQRNNTESEPTPKRRSRGERREELSRVKEEEIVVIKEELDDDEFVSAFQDGSLDSSSLNRTDQGDGSMAFFNPPGPSQAGRISFPLDQLAGGSSLQNAIQGVSAGVEGDVSWLQDSQGDTSNPQDWQGQKHQNSCQLCGKLFGSLFNLQRHMQGVHLKYRFTCDICGKSYSQAGNMAQHKKGHHQHTNEMPEDNAL